MGKKKLQVEEIVGNEGKFGSAIVGSGGSPTPVGMFTGKLGSGGRLTLGNVGCGIFERVGFGKAGNDGNPIGTTGKFGSVGEPVYKRWWAARPTSMLESVKATMKVMVKNFGRGLFFCTNF